jgi:hypothetical protein
MKDSGVVSKRLTGENAESHIGFARKLLGVLQNISSPGVTQNSITRDVGDAVVTARIVNGLKKISVVKKGLVDRVKRATVFRRFLKGYAVLMYPVSSTASSYDGRYTTNELVLAKDTVFGDGEWRPYLYDGEVVKPALFVGTDDFSVSDTTGDRWFHKNAHKLWRDVLTRFRLTGAYFKGLKDYFGPNLGPYLPPMGAPYPYGQGFYGFPDSYTAAHLGYTNYSTYITPMRFEWRGVDDKEWLICYGDREWGSIGQGVGFFMWVRPDKLRVDWVPSAGYDYAKGYEDVLRGACIHRIEVDEGVPGFPNLVERAYLLEVIEKDEELRLYWARLPESGSPSFLTFEHVFIAQLDDYSGWPFIFNASGTNAVAAKFDKWKSYNEWVENWSELSLASTYDSETGLVSFQPTFTKHYENFDSDSPDWLYNETDYSDETAHAFSLGEHTTSAWELAYIGPSNPAITNISDGHDGWTETLPGSGQHLVYRKDTGSMNVPAGFTGGTFYPGTSYYSVDFYAVSDYDLYPPLDVHKFRLMHGSRVVVEVHEFTDEIKADLEPNFWLGPLDSRWITAVPILYDGSLATWEVDDNGVGYWDYHDKYGGNDKFTVVIYEDGKMYRPFIRQGYVSKYGPEPSPHIGQTRVTVTAPLQLQYSYFLPVGQAMADESWDLTVTRNSSDGEEQSFHKTFLVESDYLGNIRKDAFLRLDYEYKKNISNVGVAKESGVIRWGYNTERKVTLYKYSFTAYFLHYGWVDGVYTQLPSFPYTEYLYVQALESLIFNDMTTEGDYEEATQNPLNNSTVFYGECKDKIVAKLISIPFLSFSGAYGAAKEHLYSLIPKQKLVIYTRDTYGPGTWPVLGEILTGDPPTEATYPAPASYKYLYALTSWTNDPLKPNIEIKLEEVYTSVVKAGEHTAVYRNSSSYSNTATIALQDEVRETLILPDGSEYVLFEDSQPLMSYSGENNRTNTTYVDTTLPEITSAGAKTNVPNSVYNIRPVYTKDLVLSKAVVLIPTNLPGMYAAVTKTKSSKTYIQYMDIRYNTLFYASAFSERSPAYVDTTGGSEPAEESEEPSNLNNCYKYRPYDYDWSYSWVTYDSEAESYAEHGVKLPDSELVTEKLYTSYLINQQPTVKHYSASVGVGVIYNHDDYFISVGNPYMQGTQLRRYQFDDTGAKKFTVYTHADVSKVGYDQAGEYTDFIPSVGYSFIFSNRPYNLV